VKKAGKITLFVVLAVFLLLAVFHSAIISYTLKRVISGSSNGKITLNIEEFHVSIFPGDITIIHPALKFEDLYLNESKSLKVEEIAFNEISIESLDLASLIFKQEIDAKRFYVDKPEFHLLENGTKNKMDFQPKGFFDALKQNDQSFTNLYFNIDDIEIHYGTITFSNSLDIGVDPGQVDFTINLEKFSTHHDSLKKDRFLYSDEFSFKVRNVHKALASGYDLDIDSATFNSAHKDFIISGIELSPLSLLKEENTIKFAASEISLNNVGLDEIRELKGIELSSVRLSEVELTSFINRKDEHIAGEDSLKKEGIDKIIKVFDNFSVDTLSISEFNYYLIKHNTDTLMTARDVNLILTELQLDSTMYSDIAKKIGFEEIALNTGAVELTKAVSGFEISYDELSYANVDNELEIQGLKVYGEKNGDVIDVKTPDIQIYGLSVHQLQKLKRQNMSIYINDPVGSVTLGRNGIRSDTEKTSLVLPFNLNFYEISVKNGNFKVQKDSVFNAAVRNLNVFAGGVKIPVRQSDTLKLLDLQVSSGAIDAFVKKGRMSIGLSGIGFRNDNFILSDLKLEQINETDTNNISVNSVEFRNLNMDSLIYDKKIYLDSLLFVSPYFKGKLITQSNDDTGKVFLSPFSLQLKNIVVENGRLNAVVKIKDEFADLSADYNLIAGPFVFREGDTLGTSGDIPEWKTGLNNLDLYAYDHHVFVKKLESDTRRSLFSIEGLRISIDKKIKGDTTDLIIRSMQVPLLRVTGLNYDMLISSDTVMFSSVMLQSPDADLVLKRDETSSFEKKGKEFDIDSLSALIYDTVSCN